MVASIKLRGSFGFVLGFWTAHSIGKGSWSEMLFQSKRLNSFDSEAKTSKDTIVKKVKAFIKFFIILIVSALNIFSSQIYAQSEGKTHWRYIDQNERFNLGDSFYRNSDYFKCEAKQQCPKIEDPEVKPKKLAYFLGREEDGFIIPVFLQCHRNGNASMTTAEDLVPLLNEDVLQNGECLETEGLEEAVPNRFVEDTLKAVRSYQGKCPKEEDGFLDHLYSSFEKDFKNAVNIFSLGKQDKVEAGCLTNLISSVIESLFQTVKMFVWDIPKGVFNIGKAGWNYFFGEEEERSTAMLASSVMSEEMAEALTDWDLAKFYGLLRKNFFDFFGGVKEFYTEIIGCSEWDGLPYSSQCLKKMDWSCPSWENGIPFICGAISQLGTGYLLGGLLGTAKSLSKMSSIKRSIASDPQRFGIVGNALNELKSKKAINEGLESVRRNSFRLRRKTRSINNFLATQKNEVKNILGIGESFMNLVKATPITMPYHHYFQRGQARGWKMMNELQMKNVKSQSIKLGRARALRLDNIQGKFEQVFVDLKTLKGDKFDPVLFKEVQNELFDSIKDELSKSGMSVSKLPDGTGLKITKGGEELIYTPRFDEKLRNMPAGISDDSIKDALSHGDLILGKQKSVSLPPETPPFWKDFVESAETSRGIFTLKPDGTDGFVYLGHFSAQTGNLPQLEDCSSKLNNVDLLRSQDITHIDTDGKEEVVAPTPAAESVEVDL